MLNILKQCFRKKPESCAAVIVAAGSSCRMQGTDKIMASMCGEPLIAHTIRAFQECSGISQIVLVTREELLSPMRRLCQVNGFDKVSGIVPGGSSRAESVSRGLDQLADARLVAIHDGARPLITPEIIAKTIEKAAAFHAAAPAVPVKDTIKTAENRIVTGTPDRASLFAVQTPQVFDFDLLRGALQRALEQSLPITDDCSAVEAMGMSVYLTDGSDENIKVTTPTDLLLAEAILKERTHR